MTEQKAALVRVVACGSIEDGEPTLIERLLAQGASAPTLDVAHRHLRLPSGRQMILADAPGHAQRTRHLAVAASTADLAVLLVDAGRGGERQTLLHLTICALLGVRHVIIAIDQLDAVDFRRSIYAELAGSLAGAAARLEMCRVRVIPVSALNGDNVVDRSSRTPWYDGPTVLEALEEVDLDVTQGDLSTTGDDPGDDPGLPADRFAVDILWMNEEPLAHGRSYLLVCGPLTVPATVTAVRHRRDVASGREEAARVLGLDEMGRIEIATDRPVSLDACARGLALVDGFSAQAVAAGRVHSALRWSANVVPRDFAVTREARERLAGHRGKVIWLTGLSGAGKSTIADATERALHGQGVRTFVLDGDNVRSGLNKDLGFSAQDRAENVRRVAEVAKLMMQSGVVVIVALISPFRSDRRAARDLFDAGDFVEVFVDTPLEVCRERDPKGLYAKAAAGSLSNLSGVGQDYEPPRHPELTLSGTGELAESVAALTALVLGERA